MEPDGGQEGRPESEKVLYGEKASWLRVGSKLAAGLERLHTPIPGGGGYPEPQCSGKANRWTVPCVWWCRIMTVLGCGKAAPEMVLCGLAGARSGCTNANCAVKYKALRTLMQKKRPGRGHGELGLELGVCRMTNSG